MIKNLFLLLVLLFGFNLLSIAQEDTSSLITDSEKVFNELFNKGVQEKNFGNYDDAISYFQKALIQKPKDAETLSMIQICIQWKQDQQNEADHQAQMILEFANKLYNEGYYEDALHYYKKYKKKKPYSTEIAEKIKNCEEKLKE